MGLPISFENGFSNGVDFFTPIEGSSQEDMLAAVGKAWESYKSIPASLGGAVLKSTHGQSIALYQMWVKDTDLGEYHEQLSQVIEGLEEVTEINPNFFEPVATGSKQEHSKYEFELDNVYGVQVFAVEEEKVESATSEVMKKMLESASGMEWYILFRSWDKQKLMVISKWSEVDGYDLSGVEDYLTEKHSISKELENAYRVIRI